ncbi:bifunctional dihydrolipoyllysine-residue acetyltransferase/dihydrolipoyllysine-residue succinyltransferase [Leptospira ryugenii]|uniref:Acetyltransferase component of pyruvate dehydrogenase complex n=1 Tax=Leptospira ryugenii TaxID=1917863 RepID=A0A2P2DWE4_9LEPT|nr:pyruvate dehydrogenase complex dihydrolipoamide acetyltransferase [Leptospira ryugenii]GBF48954.1 bifunctional dihydrolipoyllysine-residue acetyltransferase/dihydrolipoyllysine-residue succinyltransferase [Leptospira ryugenii]
MAKLIEMTQLSPTMTEGTIVKWIKKEGDSISPGEVLAEVETDKAVMEMEAYDSGVLLKIVEKEGSKLKVGEALAIIGKPGEGFEDLLQEAKAKKKEIPATTVEAPKPSPVAETVAPTSISLAQEKTTPTIETKEVVPVTLRGGARVLASPLAKSIAIEKGIDLHSLLGTGPMGRITKKDVLDYIQSRQSSPTHLSAAIGVSKQDELIPLGGMRKTIAKRLTDSKQNLPHFYLNADINAKRLESFRKEINEFFQQENPKEPLKVSVNDIITKAVANALKLHPKVNASWMEESIKQHGRIDVGIAVSLDGGLLTPVIRNADQKSIAQISTEIKELAKKARDRKLKPEEFSNGTFTISNLGMYGISRFTAIINEPESAILAVGAIEDKPVVEGAEVVAGRVISLTLSCDHRVIDGAVGAEFLKTLRLVLENPALLTAV